MKASDITWPPPPGVEYEAEDVYGTYTEVFAPGALEGAECCPGDRCFRVAEDRWDEDHTHRTILRVTAISGQREEPQEQWKPTFVDYRAGLCVETVAGSTFSAGLYSGRGGVLLDDKEVVVGSQGENWRVVRLGDVAA